MEEARRPRRRTQNGAGPRRVQTPLAAREAPSVRFVSSPWNRGASRCIGTDGWRRLWDATTPNPLRKRRGLDVLGTGDRGWRPGGLTPGYCLKPFQGFEDGLGKGRGSAGLMTGVARVWDVWRRDVFNPEVIDAAGRGWDVSSQRVLVSKAWECGDETSPPPKSVRVGMRAGTSRRSKFWVARAREVWRRDVASPEVIEGRGRGWDVSSQEVLGCEGGDGDGTSPPRGGVSDRGWHDKTEPESMAAKHGAVPDERLRRPPKALCSVSLIREIREIRGPFFARSRVGHPSWAVRAAPQPFAFVVGSAGPQTTQTDAERSGAGLANSEAWRRDVSIPIQLPERVGGSATATFGSSRGRSCRRRASSRWKIGPTSTRTQSPSALAQAQSGAAGPVLFG